MKYPKGDQPKELSDAEFVAALHAALRDEVKLFPCSVEEVEALTAQMNMDGVPTPDTEKFRQLLRDTAQKVVELPRAHPITSQDVEADMENLAMAARNGKAISPEIRRRMNEDRSKAAEQTKPRNGAH
jgi:hypothetical protein